MARWDEEYGLALDPVYTAKVALVLEGWAAPGEVHVLVHTGGLQGVEAWRRRWGGG